MHAQSRCAPENVMHFGVGLEFIRLFLGAVFCNDFLCVVFYSLSLTIEWPVAAKTVCAMM